MYSLLTALRVEKGNKYLYPAIIRGKKRCTVSQTTFIKFHKSVVIINSFTKLFTVFPTMGWGDSPESWTFIFQFHPHHHKKYSLPPTLNFNSSPQQKNSPPTKRYAVSCYFDRIWLLTIASFTNKYALTVKKWINSKKCFLQIRKNICQNPFLDWKKTLHQNFQVQ